MIIIPHMHFKCQGTLVRLWPKKFVIMPRSWKFEISNYLYSEQKYGQHIQRKKKFIVITYYLLSTITTKNHYIWSFSISTNLLFEQNSIFTPPWHNFNMTTLNITFYYHGKDFLFFLFTFQFKKICMVYYRMWFW